MSEILKNTASQSVFVTVIDSSTGAGKESGVSFTYTAAGGSQAALTNTPTHKGNGQYEVVPTQDETNVDCFSIGWYGSGVVPNCVTIYTTTKRLRDLQDLAAGAAMTLTAAYDKAKDDISTPLAVVDGLIDTLISRLTETRAGYLDAAISSRGTLTAGQVRTELATELARILTALPNAAPNAAGGLIISTAGDLDADTLVLTANSISARIPASLTANGNMRSSIVEIIATTLTETAGQIAAAFKKFFDIGTPTGTVNSLPAAIPGSNGGLPTTNGTKLNQTADLTAGQTIGISGDLSATMKTSVQAAADAAVTANTKIGAIEAKTANIPASPAAVGSEMALADGAITASKIAAAALSGKGDWNTVAPDNASAAATLALVQCDKVAILVEGVYWMSYRVAGTATEIMRKQMLDANGDPVASITTPVAAIQGAD